MSLFDRKTQLRFRRVFRRQQRQVEAATQAAERQLERNLIGRFDRFWQVKRFATAWIGLVLLLTVGTVFQTLALSGYYQTARPVAGGIYNEGMVGAYSDANPIFATGAVDTAVSRLVFAGLLKYNTENKLAGDLASGYTVDQTGKHYVVSLKPHLAWQDGQPLTARDVVFTFHLIQNPDVQSPLLSSWQNIAISAPDSHTVHFDLPNAFAAFPYSLTTGLVPQHILASVAAGELRGNSFNTTTPVGAGPFAWQGLQTSANVDPDKAVSLIGLRPFSGYAGGTPQLSGFVLHAYGTTDELVAAYKRHDIMAMAGLGIVPAGISSAKGDAIRSFGSTAAMMTFFKTSSGVLADTQVRKALIQGADTDAIRHALGYPTRAVREPLLQGQLGYDTSLQQATFDTAAANSALDAAGWTKGSDGMRSKASQTLAFRLYAEDTPENRLTVHQLVNNWNALGVKAIPVLQPLTDFQTTLEFHTYDALLYNISIGVDPDVFAYWDSSQADIRSTSRLNFSEYKSATADAALEAGRTRLDPTLRVVKYKPFLQAWQADAPALGLYQPRFLSITHGNVYGLQDHTLNVDADRYDSVASWQIHTARVTNN